MFELLITTFKCQSLTIYQNTRRPLLSKQWSENVRKAAQTRLPHYKVLGGQRRSKLDEEKKNLQAGDEVLTENKAMGNSLQSCSSQFPRLRMPYSQTNSGGGCKTIVLVIVQFWPSFPPGLLKCGSRTMAWRVRSSNSANYNHIQ